MTKQERLNKILLSNAVRKGYLGTAKILLLSGTLKDVNFDYLINVATYREDGDMVTLLKKYMHN